MTITQETPSTKQSVHANIIPRFPRDHWNRWNGVRASNPRMHTRAHNFTVLVTQQLDQHAETKIIAYIGGLGNVLYQAYVDNSDNIDRLYMDVYEKGQDYYMKINQDYPDGPWDIVGDVDPDLFYDTCEAIIRESYTHINSDQ